MTARKDEQLIYQQPTLKAMEGWIKLHRQILENAIFRRPDYLRIWIYILLKVNHRDVEDIWNNEKRVFKKGSVVLSQKKISDELRVSIGTVNNVLKYLKAENQIEIITTTKYTEIQVLKWNEFQTDENSSESNVKAKRKRGESKVNAGDTPLETNKNDNNSKNEENEKNSTADAEVTVWPTFDDFWNTYDKKIDRPKSEKLWSKLNQEAREKIMQNLEKYIPATPDKKFRKHPTTYLNGQSWNDEIIITNGKGFSKNDRTEFIENELAIIQQHAGGAPA